jgi:hypothetical protein
MDPLVINLQSVLRSGINSKYSCVVVFVDFDVVKHQLRLPSAAKTTYYKNFIGLVTRFQRVMQSLL